jgi:hypothetical protein
MCCVVHQAADVVASPCCHWAAPEQDAVPVVDVCIAGQCASAAPLMNDAEQTCKCLLRALYIGALLHAGFEWAVRAQRTASQCLL